ncbi:MAG: ATP-binding cassette domain-containing protein [Chloroflexi bacterium]|nr:ATP-binding cassette domain-containing protein [Chloroflexota bacterium]
MTADVLFQVEHVSRHFRLPRTRLFGPRRILTAVDDVSLELHREETLGIVGESGSGKTTLIKLLLGLERPDAGRVTYTGQSLRREVQVVFQDPASALDPRMRVDDTILEPLRVLHLAEDHHQRLAELLDAVGLPRASAKRYPHEFSGGQRQRIAIARALAPRPRVLIGDEPVSALDVSVRAQILNLLEDLRVDFQLTLVLVSHDLAVVRHMTDRVLVMRAGKIVEEGLTRDVFNGPRHAYTRLLLDSIPRLRPQASRK